MTGTALTAHLTRRQREVLALIAAGHTNPAIAIQLGITLHTVKAHVEAIFNAYSVTSRWQAIMAATRAGDLT